MHPEYLQTEGSSFGFVLDLPGENRRPKSIVRVLWVGSVEVTFDNVLKKLSTCLASAALPDQVWLVGLDDQMDNIVAVAESLRASDDYKQLTRYVATPPVRAVCISPNGQLSHISKDSLVNLKRWESDLLFEAGMAALFRHHGGLLRANGGYHYIRPGGSHGDSFLRTANVLINGCEVDFVASALHSRVGSTNVTHLYTDSASINVVAYSYIRVRERLGLSVGPVSIRSFGSYEGLTSGYQFDAGGLALVLVSASVSGALSRLLVNKYSFSPWQIFTLYYLAEDPGVQILCDLTVRAGRLPQGSLAAIQSWRENEPCALCAMGQSTVKLVGDQFLPADPTTKPLMLAAKDSPTWLTPIIKSIRGRRVIRVHGQGATGRGAARTIVLNLEELFKGEGSFSADDSFLAAVLNRMLQKGVPAATTTIVYLTDADSEAFALKCIDSLKSAGVNVSGVRLLSAAQLLGLQPEEALSKGVTLVVGSAIASGRTVLSVSRTLRTIHSGEPISYLFFMPRMASSRDFEALASNLRYGKFGPREFEVLPGTIIELPPDRPGESLWDAEFDLWDLALDLARQQSLELDHAELLFIENRQSALERARRGSGLQDELFLGTWNSEFTDGILRLRPGFAFWNDDYEGESITQADVYFTIAAVLQSYRGRSAASDNRHNWTVIDPSNFARYNDGVIQACITRAAIGQELDYSSNSSQSNLIVNMLETSLDRVQEQEGEAVAEMMLAIALRTMRLENDALKRYLLLLSEYEHLAPPIGVLARYSRVTLGAGRFSVTLGASGSASR